MLVYLRDGVDAQELELELLLRSRCAVGSCVEQLLDTQIMQGHPQGRTQECAFAPHSVVCGSPPERPQDALGV